MAMESSTTEIAAITKKTTAFDKEDRNNVLEFLETSDLVKFAKFEPLASEHSHFIEQAYSFVLKTKVVEIYPVDELEKPEEAESAQKNTRLE